MIHRLVAHKRKGSLANPPPILNVFVVGVRLQALFGLEVEKLKGPRLRLESDDRFCQMHNGAICSDGSPHYIVDVLEVEDDRLGRGIWIVALLAHTDVGVRLEGLLVLSVSGK